MLIAGCRDGCNENYQFRVTCGRAGGSSGAGPPEHRGVSCARTLLHGGDWHAPGPGRGRARTLRGRTSTWNGAGAPSGLPSVLRPDPRASISGLYRLGSS
jgi:hypothetical protein